MSTKNTAWATAIRAVWRPRTAPWNTGESAWESTTAPAAARASNGPHTSPCRREAAWATARPDDRRATAAGRPPGGADTSGDEGFMLPGSIPRSAPVGYPRRLRILWVATKVPWPPRDGGRLVVWYTLQAMAEAGHEIALVAPLLPDVTDPAASERELQTVCRP